MLITGPTTGQDYQLSIYTAYLQKNMNVWKEVMDEMEVNYKTESNPTLLYDLVEAEYGYVAFCISLKKRKEARVVLKKAEEHINLLLEDGLENAKIFSLLGALYGFRVYLEPLKALKYRGRSKKANQTAIRLGPDEPQAWMEKANNEYYSPAIFGGSKRRAVPLYENAVKLYELSPERIHQNWLYLNCLTGLGMAYENTGQFRNAKEVYKKLLKLEPSFSWVRDDLYPRFLQNHSMN